MSNTSTPSGGGKALLPLIVLAAAVAAGWLWIQKPTDESSLPLTEASAPMLNTIAPAAAEAGEGMSGAGATTEQAMDHDEDDMTYPPSAPAATPGVEGGVVMPVPVTIPTDGDVAPATPADNAPVGTMPEPTTESSATEPTTEPTSGVAPEETVPAETR